MKLIKLSLVIIFLGLIAPAQLYALTTSGSATGIIAAPIVINENVQMSFGKFASGASAGAVTLTPAASTNRTATGGVVLLANPTPTAGKFTITGVNNASYTVTLPTSTILFSGSDSMVMDTFISNPNACGTLDGGLETLYVGARLNVGAMQPPGYYVGTYIITVSYS